MNRTNASGMHSQQVLNNYKKKVAYHEAGHAAAIHINNRLKNLPPIFFQIIFQNELEKPLNSCLNSVNSQTECIAKVSGGLLMQTLYLDLKGRGNQEPLVPLESPKFVSEYHLAFEADIVNLLIGPLAEAKYTAHIDGEPFNEELITVQALKNYGGETDLAVINNYLQSYSADIQVQNESLNKLFMQAYNFVNDKVNWRAISRLADYIVSSKESIIGYDEVALLLDN